MANGFDFDAIVVGSGISGGWAAKELTEKGLETLVLERGKPLEHITGYTGEHTPPWDQPFNGLPLRRLYQEEYPVQSTKAYAFEEPNRHFWNNDKDNPYQTDPERPFEWIRADVVGGRSLLWWRQVYRWSDLDFEANKKDGHGIDWPIRYADIAPWYGYVERFIGVSGEKLGLLHLPDGEFQKPMEMNVVEKMLSKHIQDNYPGRHMTIGRVAVMTEPLPHSDRGVCHYCLTCYRGCSVGAYFSSLSSTLPAAEATGNLTLEANSLVEKVVYDSTTGRAIGVDVIDTETRERRHVTAKLIFLNASTVASTQILLNSNSERFPNGLANGSGVLGRYLMDHTSEIFISGEIDGFEKYYPYGARPNGIYIPRFRNLDDSGDVPFLRGYGYQGFAERLNWRAMAHRVPGFGVAYKNAMRTPGPWRMQLFGFGECLPYLSNRIELHPTLRDRFGVPQVQATFEWGENEIKQRHDILEEGQKMLSSPGFRITLAVDTQAMGGRAIHEMGTARMGKDPRESVLNAWNQAHEVPNLFLTDGSCMTSSSCVNPSITYMALTARAVDYAVRQLQDGAI